MDLKSALDFYLGWMYLCFMFKAIIYTLAIIGAISVYHSGKRKVLREVDSFVGGITSGISVGITSTVEKTVDADKVGKAIDRKGKEIAEDAMGQVENLRDSVASTDLVFGK